MEGGEWREKRALRGGGGGGGGVGIVSERGKYKGKLGISEKTEGFTV